MDCPVCNTAMVVLEYDDVELDYCVQCAGIWLDTGELELLLGDRALIAGFLEAGNPAPKGEATRRCPTCRGKMDKRATGGPFPVLYDRCPVAHGLWFDRGELATVLQHGSAAPGGEAVVAWLRAMFPDAVVE